MSEETIKQRAAKSIDFRELRRYRLARVQEQLQRSGLGAVLLFEPQNIRYDTVKLEQQVEITDSGKDILSGLPFEDTLLS